ETQPTIHVGVGEAGLGGHRNLACQFGEYLGLGRVLAALAVHNVFELRMAGHLFPNTLIAPLAASRGWIAVAWRGSAPRYRSLPRGGHNFRHVRAPANGFC